MAMICLIKDDVYSEREKIRFLIYQIRFLFTAQQKHNTTYIWIMLFEKKFFNALRLDLKT